MAKITQKKWMKSKILTSTWSLLMLKARSIHPIFWNNPIYKLPHFDLHLTADIQAAIEKGSFSKPININDPKTFPTDIRHFLKTISHVRSRWQRIRQEKGGV